MNLKEFDEELGVLINHASRQMEANFVIEAVLRRLAYYLAVVTNHTKSNPNDVIEVIRHELDVAYVEFLKVADATNS